MKLKNCLDIGFLGSWISIVVHMRWKQVFEILIFDLQLLYKLLHAYNNLDIWQGFHEKSI